MSPALTRGHPAKRSPKDALKQARRDVHRQHLLEAAERVFADRGYEHARMQDVAAEAGLAIATVYGIIGGKEELLAEVHRVRGRALLDAATQATLAARSPLAAILAGIRGYTEYLLAHPDYLRLHLEESQPWALSPRFTTQEQSRLWREGLELTVELFRVAIGDRSVIGENPATLARLMIAAHQVFLGEWVERGMTEPKAALIDRMQAHVARAFAL